MSQVAYDQLVSKIESLTLPDQVRLLEQISVLVRKKTTRTSASRSIMELRGKGKGIWQRVDVKRYIDEERSSWAG